MCPNPDARLVFFGEGSQRDRLAALAAGDRRIEFRGHADDPAEAYRAVDVVAMRSRWEAYGLVPDEARAGRRPVIVSMVDGLRDRIGASGVIPCGSDPKAWRKSIEAVLAGTPPVVAAWLSAIPHEGLARPSPPARGRKQWMGAPSVRPMPVG